MEDPKNVIMDRLRPGEELLWCGQPDDKIRLTRLDWLYFASVPGFIVMIVVFWKMEQYRTFFPFLAGWMVFGILYACCFQLLIKRSKKKRLYYGITNQRILMASDGLILKKRTYLHWMLSETGSIEKKDHKGAGTIIFRDAPISLTANSNFLMGADRSPAFYDLKDCDRVLKILYEAKDARSGSVSHSQSHH